MCLLDCLIVDCFVDRLNSTVISYHLLMLNKQSSRKARERETKAIVINPAHIYISERRKNNQSYQDTL